MEKKTNFTQKEIKPINGMGMLILITMGILAAIALIVVGCINLGTVGIAMIIVGGLGVVILPILYAGLKVVGPNEALVLTLFGNYHGTILKQGFYFVNPFSTYANPTNAVFNVEDYAEFLSIQTDSTIRNIARMYPYDSLDTDDHEHANEKTLRGSSQEIADNMKAELNKKVAFAGLEIEEVRITHLSYAEEIAAAMLRRQQAEAVISARAKIVDGAVSMVKMAIDKLGEEEVVFLDEERKAAMVSNLMVVLCSDKDTQPIVNSGSIY